MPDTHTVIASAAKQSIFSRVGKQGKARPSFLKKRSKKLLLTAGVGTGGATAPSKQKFFCFFFFKKRSAYFLAFLSSCAPTLPPPDTRIPAPAYLPGPSPGETANLPAAWWQSFDNPALNALVAAGLAASPSIAEAIANLTAARQNATANDGAFLPQIGLNPDQPDISRTAEPGGPNGFPPYTVYALGGTISYDPGLFGARKYTFENGAALADYQAAELDAARQSVAGNIVAAAIIEAGAEAQIGTTQNIIAAEQKLFTLLKGEFADGAIPELNVLQQKSTILATEATLPALRTEAGQQRDRLAILTGQLPASFAAPDISLDALTAPAPVPISLPSAYLENRPDLRAARAQVAAQNAALGVAISHLYPDLQLTASGGWVALTLNPLFSPATAFWSLAGNLLVPLYDGGQLHARKQAAQAQLAAALAAYHDAVLNAFAQAADALQAVQNDETALQSAQDAAGTADQAYNLASQQFALGAVDYTTVLTAQAAAAQQALALVQAKTTLLLDIARLQAAMAG
jgi:NodT family efflux transporter outer membrane factor (OMF) lipoprotein